MKKIILMTMAVVLIAFGAAFGAGLEVKQKAGEYNVEIKLDKNPPIVGSNNVEIEVKDSAGKYVTDAKVKVDYSMPAMPGMPAMNYKTDAVLSGQKYTAKMDLSMSGPWNIAVKISKGGKTSTVKFNVDAQ
ncbi:MAG TPA: FixH family protein [Dissulfurispiraceae bacterium]|nr:FixH family protein [Dissulfurispiraceae bacterium]